MIDQDLKLICQQSLQGDRKAQRRLYDLFCQPLYMLCLRYATDRQEAQDMLQEGFLNIYRDLHQFDADKASLHTWMRKVIVNACLQFIRKNKKMQFDDLPAEEMVPHQYHDDSSIKELNIRRVLRLLQDLPAGYRLVFNLHVMEGYSHNEIAESLNISPNTSKTQLFKAKAMLRKWMKIQPLRKDSSPIANTH